MALQHPLTKHTYEYAAEPVSSQNLNDIQDAVVELQDQSIIKSSQSLTTAEKTQARANIAAISEDDAGFTNMIEVTMAGITSLPKTFTATGITANHELVQNGFALVTPSSSEGSDWTLTPGNGTITVSGTFSGSTSTTIEATFVIKKNKVNAVAQ